MSTILDVLKKVERERQSPRERLLDAAPEPPRHRGRTLVIIAACAVVGFAGGVGLALWRSEPPLETAALQVPAPPAIDVPLVPAAPALPAAPAPPVPPAPAPASEGEASRVTAPAPALPQAETVRAQAPAAAEVPAVSDVPAEGTTGTDVANSAIEPSPFALARPVTRPVPDPQAPADVAPSAATREPANQAVADQAVAALTPPSDVEVPEPDAELEPEAAPPAEPEVVIDTGRAPAGAPRVTLSFLQWSADPARRFAFVSVDGAPAQRVREGDVASGLTVAHITPSGVQFRQDSRLFTVRARH